MKKLFTKSVALCIVLMSMIWATPVKADNHYYNVQNIVSSNDHSVCVGDTVFVYQNGLNGSFSYRVLPNSVQTSGADTIWFTETFRIGFNSLSFNLPWTYFFFAIPVQSSGLENQSFCGSNPIVLHVGGDSIQYAYYLWSTGATTDSIITNISGDYWIRQTNACNIVIDTFHLEFTAPNAEIEVVTFDIPTQKNKVILHQDAQVDSSYIYKLDQNNQMSLIGKTLNTNGYYLDPDSNPPLQQAQYGIMVRDTCNNISAMSALHRTIWLLISSYGPTVYFQYFPYAGVFVATYTVRGLRSNGTVDSLLSIASSLQNFSLPLAVTQLYEKIYMDFAISIGGSKQILSVKSNTIDVTTLIQEYLNTTTKIYPNPIQDVFYIESIDGIVQIYNPLGQLVINTVKESPKITISLGGMPAGIYTIRLISKYGVITKKVIKT